MGAAVLWLVVGSFVLLIAATTWVMNSRVAGERGWVFNRFNPRTRGGGTLGLLESIYQPSIEHVIEERSSERARGTQDAAGDKPEAGRGAAEPD